MYHLSKPNLFILTTGNAAAGLGHVSRCMALCRHLKEEFDSIRFVMKLADRDCLISDFATHFTDDRTAFIAQHSAPGDHVILDDYTLTAGDAKRLKAAGLWTIGINDLPEEALPCHVIINHLPGISPDLFSHLKGSHLLLGAKYLLLRPEFLNEIYVPANPAAGKGLLIAMGGTDPDGLNLHYLRAAENLGIKPVHILTSALNPQLDALKKIAGHDQVFIHYGLNADQLIALFKSCSFCLLTASTLTLEAMCVKIAIATGYTHSNQVLLAQTCAKHETAINAGDFHHADAQEILKTLLASDTLKVKNAQFQLLKEADPIHFRDVMKNMHPYYQFCQKPHANRNFKFIPFTELSEDEALNILNWRNHADIRQWMLNPEPISKENHLNFIEKLKTAKTSGYWLCYYQEKPVGVINTLQIDTEKGYCEPGYYLIPEQMKSGLGLKMATAFYELLFASAGYKKLGGYIHKKNITALMNAKAMGFDMQGEQEINGTLFREVVLRPDQLRVFS